MATILRAVHGIKTVLRDIDRGFATLYGRDPSSRDMAPGAARKTLHK